jgi:hypothetical protein
MKRLFFAVAVAAVASIAVAATASAKVDRYQAETATFTVTQPLGQVGQWSHVWTHNYTVTVNPCDGTFTGTGKQYDDNGNFYADETVNGSFSGGKVNLTATRPSDGLVYTLAGAPTDNTTVTLATTTPVVPWVIEMKVTNPVFTNTSDYKNHGDYVSSQGGGDDAAHSCIGMPITK